jgi:hypothetical protein
MMEGIRGDMKLGDQVLIEDFFGGVNGGIGCSFVKQQFEKVFSSIIFAQHKKDGGGKDEGGAQGQTIFLNVESAQTLGEKKVH